MKTHLETSPRCLCAPGLAKPLLPLMGLVVVMAGSQANAQQAQPLNTQVYYRLTTQWRGDDMSLDIVNDGKANNQPILAKTGNFSGQLWKLTPTNVKVEGAVSGPVQASITGHEVVRVSKQVTLAPGAFDSLTVKCPEGKKVFGGGSGDNGWTHSRIIPVLSIPSPNTSTFNKSQVEWTVGFMNLGTTAKEVELAAFAICAVAS